MTTRNGELVIGIADVLLTDASVSRDLSDNGQYEGLISGIVVPPLLFKNQGWYGTGSVYETWQTPVAPDLLPPSGHTLADVQHFPIET